MAWTPEQLPTLAGQTIVITGGNSGLGLEAAKILTAREARVIITTRSEAKAKGALHQIRAASPGADVEAVLLDLADLQSVDAGAEAIREETDEISAFINNAGVMQTPFRQTADGFELQLGTNHLGHFRLNSRLFDLVEAARGRIVAVASLAHWGGRIHLGDLHLRQRYSPSAAYFQSKLANLMYALELQRRLAARDSAATAHAAHPGYANTNLQTAGVGMEGGSRFFSSLYKVGNPWVAQSADRGAWPLVLAAAAPEARPGAYYGPTGLFELWGEAGEARMSKAAQDEAVAKALWAETERLVGPFFG